MNNKEKKQNHSSNSKLRSFLLFLLLATFFWFLTKFSKEYTTTIQTNIEYINIPSSYTLLSDAPKTINLDVSGNGFSFLFFKIKKPTININITDYINKNPLTITIPNNKLQQIISSQLDNNIKILALDIDTLVVHLDTHSVKKVPVKLDVDLSFEKGYFLIDEAKVSPDSVQVSGPSKWIDTLKFVKTKHIKKELLKGNETETVLLELVKNIQATPNQINLSIEVAEFTQKELQLPVELINIPQDRTISLIPQQVRILFSISIEDFKKVSSNDFILVCDFSKRDEESHTIPIQIKKSPSRILQVKIEPALVEYLVFK